MSSNLSLCRFTKTFWIICLAAISISCGTSTPQEVVMTGEASTAAAAGQNLQAVTAPAGTSKVIPRPVSESQSGGTFTLSPSTGIFIENNNSEIKAIGEYLAKHLNPSTGFEIKVQSTTGEPGKGNIHLTLEGASPALGDEGYQLEITPDLITLRANQPAGLFHGIQSIRQLLPASIDSPTLQPGPWLIDTGSISDSPRFAWRGAMLDVARHFFSVRDVTRYIDLLAYYKFNVFHLHLTDDQGWRIQIKSRPNLTVTGGSLETGGTAGGYYSQDDYAYIVEYAKQRYITVIPEIDGPGHTNAALASYPELNCDGMAPDLYTGTRVGFSSFCIAKDATYKFMEEVIAEVAALTPGKYIHIGGDEAHSTPLEDYTKFIQMIQPIVEASGKQVIGWDEIAQGKLLPGSIAQHWNLEKDYALLAFNQGAKIIMSPAEKTYLDMKYAASTSLGQDWAGYITIETGYSWDPAKLIPGIPEEGILGVEAPIWSETLESMADVEYMAFPRLLGYAEIGWSPQGRRDWNEYKTRLSSHGPRLEALDVNFYHSPEIAWP